MFSNQVLSCLKVKNHVKYLIHSVEQPSFDLLLSKIKVENSDYSATKCWAAFKWKIM